jgi:phenylalanyl-tRNA synthetase beta chain
MTVIADDKGVHDIAGIMGGEHSGVSAETTTDVLLEIAYFDPARIGATGRKLNLTSDARTRFERGVDPASSSMRARPPDRLILEICGGEASEWSAPANAAERPRWSPTTRPGRTAGRRGRAGRRAARILARSASARCPTGLASPCRWRPDVDGAADIVEEVVRIHGLDKVASVAAAARRWRGPADRHARQKLERRLRRAAAARGLNEAVTWSFLPEAARAAFAEGRPLWVLANPISEDMKAMRPSLLPGLLAAAKRNLDRGASRPAAVRDRPPLSARDDGQQRRAPDAGRGAGGREDPARLGNWQGAAASTPSTPRPRRWRCWPKAGAPVANLQVMGEAGPQFHPGQSATLRLGPKTVLARFGMLHPATLKRLRHRRAGGGGGAVPRCHSGARRAAAFARAPMPRPRCRR